jgi:hypothetical protein
MKFRPLLLLALLPLVAYSTGFGAAQGATPEQIRISWSASPQSALAIIWQTALVTDNPVVEYGTDEKLGKKVSAERVTYPYETGVINQAVIDGLKPGKRYFYRVGDPATGFSAVSSFETAPKSRDDFVFTAFGDHGVGEVSKANVTRVLEEKPAFHLIMGDLSYANGIQPVWDDYFRQLEPLARTIPVMPATGNHENERIAGERIGYAAFLARMALPPPETRYSFDYGAARFVCFNSDDFRNEEQMAWFKETLKKAREDNKVRWVIVYQHHPLYSSNVRRLNNLPLIATVRSILDQYKVDLVLAGHNHNYERSFPLLADTVAQTGQGPYQQGQGVVFVISGGGGKSLYEFTPEVPAVTASRESIPHYLRVRASKSKLKVDAIRTSDRSLIESFTIQSQ